MLYLGQQHIIDNISATMNRTTFDAMWQRTSKAFNVANLGEVIGILQEYFGPEKFTLVSLFADEKIKIIREITESSLASAESSFRNVFDANYQLMTGLERSGPAPARCVAKHRRLRAECRLVQLSGKNGDTAYPHPAPYFRRSETLAGHPDR